MGRQHLLRRSNPALVALALVVTGAAALSLLLLAQGARSQGAPSSSRSQTRHGLEALPLSARGVVGRALGAHDGRWFAHPSPGGFVLGSGGTGVQASFSRRDAIVRAGAVSWSLGLRAYGYGERLRAVGPVSATARASQVVYRRAGMAEWYAGGPAGLEQGFTLARPPSAPHAGPLTLSIGRLPAGLTARVDSDRRGLVLAAGGHDLLRYGSLFASDSHGRSLPARIELSGGRVHLVVDDRGAAYPLRVDPLVQFAKLSASGGALGDQLGYSIAISSDGSTIAAGAPQSNANQGPMSNVNQGAVYVFTEQARGWANATQTAELVAQAGAANDRLGSSVAISADGSTVVAGAPGRTSGSGAAYVFLRAGGPWSNQNEAAELTASGGAANDAFGSSIAVSADGSTAATGAPGATGVAAGTGAAYVFVKPVGGWSGAAQHETAKLTASDGAADDGLGGDNGGNAIAVSGDGSTVAAGAATAPASGCSTTGCSFGPGAVYVFVRPNSGWASAAQTAKLTASDGQGGGPGGGDRFGDAVATSSDGSTIVAGAWDAAVIDNGQSMSEQGAVYVFVKPAGGWTGTAQHQTAKLTAQDGQGQDKLGRAVAVSSDGSTIVAGAWDAAVAANAAQGKVYVFKRPAAGWTTGTAQAEVTAADGGASDELGFSVATTGDGSAIVGGARFATVGANSDQGAGYVFAAANSGAPPPGGFPVGGGGSRGAPAVGGAGVFPSSFPAAPSGPSAQAARVRKYGTRVTFTLLNQAASVRFTVQQSRPGRKIRHGKRTICARPTKKNAKRKRCTRIVTLKGSFTVAGVVGTNSFRFTGRLKGKRLAPGKYTLVATPSANGKTGASAKVSFKIVR